MKATHQVLDLVYTPSEGQDCFEGSEQECYEFIEQQGGATFMYKVVPIIHDKTNEVANHYDWCKIFDDMQESPYIDLKTLKECDRLAILSWLSSNYQAPLPLKK